MLGQPGNASAPHFVVDVSLVLFGSDPVLVAKTFAGLKGQEYLRSVRVLINDSDPGEQLDQIHALAASELGIPCLVQADGRNYGFARGHNLLADAAISDGASHVLILNPDVELYETAVASMLEAGSSVGQPALISGVLLLKIRGEDHEANCIDSRGTVWTRTCRHLDKDHGKLIRDVELTGEIRRTAALTGALILVPKEAWTRIVTVCGEFFDEDFFAYREDAELGLRADILGIPSLVLDRAVGEHWRGNPGAGRQNTQVNWLSTRNRFLLASKYARWRRPGSALPRAVRDLEAIVALLTIERENISALHAAWRLRPKMRTKRAALKAAHHRY